MKLKSGLVLAAGLVVASVAQAAQRQPTDEAATSEALARAALAGSAARDKAVPRGDKASVELIGTARTARRHRPELRRLRSQHLAPTAGPHRDGPRNQGHQVARPGCEGAMLFGGGPRREEPRSGRLASGRSRGSLAPP
jgi:hypothetical protein